MWVTAGGFFLGLLPASEVAVAPHSQIEAQDVHGRARVRALLVGVGDYPRHREGLSAARYEASFHLDGPPRDALLLRAALIEALGAEPQDLRVLVDPSRIPAEDRPPIVCEAPTLAAIQRGMAWLCSGAREGDLTVIYLSGHGTRCPDLDGEAGEPDGMDEVFLPQDAGDWRSADGAIENALVDDDLGRELAMLRTAGARVWLIADSCFSGTLARGACEAVRGLDPSVFGVPPGPAARGEGVRRVEDHPLGTSAAEVIAFYGASPFDPARELPLPTPRDGKHGVMTFSLVSALLSGGAGRSFEELFEDVSQTSRRLHGKSSPTADGPLDQPLVPGAPFERVLLLHPPESARDGSWRLSAGALSGLARGARIAVLGPTGQPEEPSPLGYLEVDEALLGISLCRPIAHLGLEPPAWPEGTISCRAAIAALPVDVPRLRLAVDAAGAAERDPGLARGLPADLAAALESLASRVEIAPQEDAQASLFLGERTWIESSVLGSPRAECLPRADLRLALASLARLHGLLEIADTCRGPLAVHVGNQPVGEVSVRILLLDGTGTQPLPPGETLRPGQAIAFELANTTGRDVDLFLIDCLAGWSIKCWRGPERVPTGRTLIVPPISAVSGLYADDHSLGPQSLIVIALAPGDAGAGFARTLEGAARPARGGSSSSALSSAVEDLLGGSSGARVGARGSGPAFESVWTVDYRIERGALAATLVSTDTAGAQPALPALVPDRGPIELPVPWTKDLAGLPAWTPEGREDAPDVRRARISGPEGATVVFVDLGAQPRSTGPRSPDLVLVCGPDGQDARVVRAAYDRDGDGEPDLILAGPVEGPAAPTACAGFELAAGSWRPLPTSAVPLVALDHLSALRAQVAGDSDGWPRALRGFATLFLP